MFCASCGAVTADTARFCSACGASMVPPLQTGSGSALGTAAAVAAPATPPVPPAATPAPASAPWLEPPTPVATSAAPPAPRRAGVIRRFLAFCMDIAVVFEGMAIVYFYGAGRWGTTNEFGTSLEGAPGAAFVLVPLAAALVFFAYFVAFEATLGATPAKLVLGARVRSTDGGRCGVLPGAVRALLRPIDLPLVGLVSALLSKTRQRLGDRLAGTVVIRNRYPWLLRALLAVAGLAVAVIGAWETIVVHHSQIRLIQEQLKQMLPPGPAIPGG